MANNKQIGALTQSQNNEALLILGMFRIVNYESCLIIKYGTRFLKRNFVFPFVDIVFILVPLKAY